MSAEVSAIQRIIHFPPKKISRGPGATCQPEPLQAVTATHENEIIDGDRVPISLGAGSDGLSCSIQRQVGSYRALRVKNERHLS